MPSKRIYEVKFWYPNENKWKTEQVIAYSFEDALVYAQKKDLRRRTLFGVMLIGEDVVDITE